MWGTNSISQRYQSNNKYFFDNGKNNFMNNSSYNNNQNELNLLYQTPIKQFENIPNNINNVNITPFRFDFNHYFGNLWSSGKIPNNQPMQQQIILSPSQMNKDLPFYKKSLEKSYKLSPISQIKDSLSNSNNNNKSNQNNKINDYYENNNINNNMNDFPSLEQINSQDNIILRNNPKEQNIIQSNVTNNNINNIENNNIINFNNNKNNHIINPYKNNNNENKINSSTDLINNDNNDNNDNQKNQNNEINNNDFNKEVGEKSNNIPTNIIINNEKNNNIIQNISDHNKNSEKIYINNVTPNILNDVEKQINYKNIYNEKDKIIKFEKHQIFPYIKDTNLKENNNIFKEDKKSNEYNGNEKMFTNDGNEKKLTNDGNDNIRDRIISIKENEEAEGSAPPPILGM